MSQHDWKIVNWYTKHQLKKEGSVEEWLTQDQGIAGLSLMGRKESNQTNKINSDKNMYIVHEKMVFIPYV